MQCNAVHGHACALRVHEGATLLSVVVNLSKNLLLFTFCFVLPRDGGYLLTAVAHHRAGGFQPQGCAQPYLFYFLEGEGKKNGLANKRK